MGAQMHGDDLTGKLLVAMPGMADPRFDRAVVFICAHGEDGTLGLIVNKPAHDLRFSDLLEQMQIRRGAAARDIRVMIGGPVEIGRGFVLHSPEYTQADATLGINSDYGMTATQDILAAIASGQGPARALLMLGFSGWGPGQLQQEILQNSWLVTGARSDIVLGNAFDTKWHAALSAMGVDPNQLSAAAGRA